MGQVDGGTAPGTSPLMPLRVPLLRAGVLSFLASLPLLAHPPNNDDRFDPFRWGADYAARPSGIASDQLGLVRFHLTTHGNFRPVGRMMERAQDTLVWSVSDGLGIPMHLVLRAGFALSAAMLALTVVLLVSLLTSRPGELVTNNFPVLLTPMIFPTLVIASGPAAPIVLFADIYMQTMALVMMVSMILARDRYLRPGPVRAVEVIVAAFVGLLIAGFNEMAALAIPLAVGMVIVRALVVSQVSFSALIRLRAVRLLGAALSGFALLFVPVQLWLSAHCVDNPCYAPSLARVTGSFPVDFVERALSWLPPLAWPHAVDPNVAWLVPGLPTIIGSAVAGVITIRIVRQLPAASGVPRSCLVALAIVGAGLVVLGAALGAASVYVQTREFPIGTGWRDTVVTTSGGALILVAAAVAGLQRVSDQRRSLAVSVLGGVFLVTFVITSLVNDAWTDTMRQDADARLFTQMSLAMVNLDPSIRANADRCRLVERALEGQPDDSYRHIRLEPALDMAAMRAGGQAFCRDLEAS